MESVVATSRRYECKWRVDPAMPDRQIHFWVDHEPTKPHWPDSAVMRWDLRQDDWHLIWPELIDHPCAKLFAPKHPSRAGPKRFSDWVASWPSDFNWKQELPIHLHPAIDQALTDIAGSDGLPKDQQDAPPAYDSDLPQPRDASELVERLAVVLLEADDSDRFAISQALSTLAMAPDSGRTLDTLKRLLQGR